VWLKIISDIVIDSLLKPYKQAAEG